MRTSNSANSINSLVYLHTSQDLCSVCSLGHTTPKLVYFFFDADALPGVMRRKAVVEADTMAVITP